MCVGATSPCYVAISGTRYCNCKLHAAAPLDEDTLDAAHDTRAQYQCPVYRVSFHDWTDECCPKHAMIVGTQLPKHAVPPRTSCVGLLLYGTQLPHASRLLRQHHTHGAVASADFDAFEPDTTLARQALPTWHTNKGNT